MLKILVAGGGIAGLTTALAFAHRHADMPVEVHVFEQAAGFDALGAGIQLSPNAMRVLIELGLRQQLTALATEPLAASIRHYRTGKPYASVALRRKCRLDYGAPYFQFYRPDLLQILTDAAHQAGVQIHFDCAVRGYTQDRDTAYLHLQNGTHHEGHIVIGADGINSSIRAQMVGDAPADFSGTVAWRGVVPSAQLPSGLIPNEATLWVGAGQHFVAYYVRGQQFINFVAVVQRADWGYAPTYKKGDMAELRRHFDGWHQPIQALLAASEASTLWGLFDRPPLACRCDGRVALAGDACHPMLPFVAQGAAMAIEDAFILAREVTSATSAPRDLLNYAFVRKRRTDWMQALSRRNGRRYHRRGLWGGIGKHLMFGAGAVAYFMKRMYGFDAAEG